ncbi:MAG: UvrD-helicase domain-containing protein [Deltaproteobacteria bacterium]|nr:UvrD-helicase domain-containing protein [Deltaproteobacteria bacterium]
MSLQSKVKRNPAEFRGYELTKEQVYAIQCIISGEDTKTQAPAGSGKTFTLEAAADRMGDEVGLYLAFNKAIADEAGRKFGNNTDCRTGHSLAFGGCGYKYKDRLGKITGMMIANSGNMGDLSSYPTKSNKGYVILDTIRRFCYSDDPKIEHHHAPVIKGPYSDLEVHQMREEVYPIARKVWEKIRDEKSSLPITHDHYLKMWALGNPQINKDYILFDEAQDANAVILGVVRRQKNCQKIYVGDKFQQIYGWRGAINAMDSLSTKHHAFITQSFRFGHGVADMANKILGCYMHPSDVPPNIIGFDQKESIVVGEEIDDPDVLICRTNTGVITNVFKYLELSKAVYVQGGVAMMMNMLRGADDLMNGKRTYVPDLALFSTWAEVVECSETESGADLRNLVSMIKDHGIPKLLDALNCTHKSHFGADITITTAHKAKGLEWEKVKLYNDFQCPTTTEDGKPIPLQQAEINILYVAATRALDVLDISACAACHDEVLFSARDSF